MAPTLHSHQYEQLFRTLIFHWLKHAWPGGTDSRKVQGRRLSRPPTLWGGGRVPTNPPHLDAQNGLSESISENLPAAFPAAFRVVPTPGHRPWTAPHPLWGVVLSENAAWPGVV